MAVDPGDMWRGMVGIGMIVIFVSILGGIAYLLYGPGISIEVPSFFKGKATTTAATASPQAPVDFLNTQEGQLFSCDGGKALKAGFVGTNVSLALSDGRVVT